MAIRTSVSGNLVTIEPKPKKTRQGLGKHTKYSATSRNGTKKRLDFHFARRTQHSWDKSVYKVKLVEDVNVNWKEP